MADSMPLVCIMFFTYTRISVIYFSNIENSDMLQKMKNIREMQEKLTVKHFEIDQSKMTPETASGTAIGEDTEEGQLQQLIQSLEKLGSTIQSLHSKQPARKDTSRRVSMKMDQPSEV